MEDLLHEKTVFETRPRKIVYAYDRWQPRFDRMKKRDGITFYKGIPDTSHLPKWFPSGGVLVLDDLMEEGGQDKRVLDLFTKDSHHRNITVLFLTQDLFPPGKFSKSINRNAHYLVAFKSPRDKTGIRNVLQQMYPGKWRPIMEVYNQVTSAPFGYLFIDVHPTSDDRYRLWSRLTKKEGTPRVHTEGKDVPHPHRSIRKRPRQRSRQTTSRKQCRTR